MSMFYQPTFVIVQMLIKLIDYLKMPEISIELEGFYITDWAVS